MVYLVLHSLENLGRICFLFNVVLKHLQQNKIENCATKHVTASISVWIWIIEKAADSEGWIQTYELRQTCDFSTYVMRLAVTNHSQTVVLNGTVFIEIWKWSKHSPRRLPVARSTGKGEDNRRNAAKEIHSAHSKKKTDWRVYILK